MPITNLQRSFREGGRIRIGDKGERGNPHKLDTFRLTSASKLLLDAAAECYGGEVQKWEGSPTEGQWELYTRADAMPVYIPPGQGQLDQWFELWSAGGCQRRCTGEWETLSDQPCLCGDSQDPDDRQCKITTRVKVMLSDLPDIVVWRLESHGYYAAVELAGTMAILSEATRQGVLLPAQLRLEQRQAKRIKDGKPLTLKYPVPVLEMPTVTGRQLIERMAGGGPPALSAPAEQPPEPEPPHIDTILTAIEQASSIADLNKIGTSVPATLGPEDKARIRAAWDAKKAALNRRRGYGPAQPAMAV